MATTLSPAPAAPSEQSAKAIRSFLDSYLFRKLIRTLLTIFVVTTITFFLVRLLPGNPIEIYVNQLVVTYGMPLNEAQDQAA